jgi:Domain of unknown function (DUF4760)
MRWDVVDRYWRVTIDHLGSWEFWEGVGKVAPIATALIALVAASIALRAINAQRDIARRRAAIDFFLKTEMDTDLVKLYKLFKQIAPTLKEGSLSDFTKTEHYHQIRDFLAICELIAVGVNEQAFSARVSWAYWGDILPQSYRDAKPLIDYVRKTPGEGTSRTCCELEKLCNRWAKRPPKRGH